MEASIGLINIAEHALLSKEVLWLSSVFAGIIMCKTGERVFGIVGLDIFGRSLFQVIGSLPEALYSSVYELTGAVSSLFFKGYSKLDNMVKLEWNNRGFSTFHAIIVAASSIYLLLASNLFAESDDELIVNRTSTLSDSILGISIGYFLTDLAMIIYNFPALGGMEYVLHHGLSMYSIIQSLLSGQALIYILMVLFTESTTPFVNLRWYLDIAGQKSSKLYIFNGVVLFLGWLVARVLLFIYFFYHMFIHFDQVKKVYPLGFYSLLTVPPVLAIMNVFWFWKITKGLIKTLNKARHTE